MSGYSEFIVQTMEGIDKKIELLSEGSVNKKRLHNAIHMCLIIKVKKLYELEACVAELVIEDIFKTELINEIVKMRKERA